MNTETLGQFLLSKYTGSLLGIKDIPPSPADSIGAVVDPLDNLLTEHVRFKFKYEKPSLNEIRLALLEYYEKIGWEVTIEEPQSDFLTGGVNPAEAETYLSLMSFYDAKDGHVLIVVTNPVFP